MNCPICASLSRPDARHPEVELYRCTDCGHRFSRLKPGLAMEPYDADYFEKTHRNWFAHPDLELFARIARLLGREPAPRSLIDVGCGNGNLLRYLAGQPAAPAALAGIDLMTNAPQAGIEFIRGDALSTDVGRQFSVVVSLAAIEHVLDAHGFARRLKALARPGGLVIVMTLNDDSLLYAAARLLRRLGVTLPFDRLYSRHHLHHFNRASLSRLLEDEGLRPEGAMLHNAPLAAIDMPAPSGAAALVMRAGVALLFATGALLGRTYLQTVVFRRPIA